MHLVSLITDQVQTKQDLFRNEGKIMDSLMSSGYRLHEADAALTLMQSLSRSEDDDHPRDQRAVLKGGMRSMNTEERSRFTIEAFGFITKLASLGIISVEHRDEILDRALSLHAGRIELSHMKSLLVLDLFANDMEHGDMRVTGPDHRSTVWN